MSDANSDSEESRSNSASSDDDEQLETPAVPSSKAVSDYEKVRLSRIAENQAKLKVLGVKKLANILPKLASTSSHHEKQAQPRCKGKYDDDEDYKPNDDENCEEDDDTESCSEGSDSPSSSKKAMKASKSNKKDSGIKQSNGSESNEDEDLMQAIRLSLLEHSKNKASSKSKDNRRIQEDAETKKRKKPVFNSHFKMNEDDVIFHFFQFDESGRGTVNARDLRRAARDHDFTWTETELDDMIQCFDNDKDGKINLDDFRRIVTRCNMLQSNVP